MYHAWEKCIKNLDQKPEGNRPLGSHRHRLEDNKSITSYLKEAMWVGSSGLISLGIGTSGRRLRSQHCILRINKLREIA
jgi:hypothetical protein